MNILPIHTVYQRHHQFLQTQNYSSVTEADQMTSYYSITVSCVTYVNTRNCFRRRTRVLVRRFR
jgi:hypothetical protein